MAGFKETPRQKMIGMMYLVLTALLALNVSKEILEAFVIVNESVEQTSANFSEKVADLHADFSIQNSLDRAKVGPFYDKSVIVKNKSQELINYIDSLKFYVISKVEKIPFDSAKVRTLKHIHAKDNYETPTNILVGEEGFKKAKGYELQKKIDAYRAAMLQLIPEKDRASFKLGLKTDGDYKDADGARLNWVRHNFYHTILAADVTIFNKLINEVHNSEYDVVSYLYQDITKEDFKFSSITAKVLPTSVFVFQGDSYKADVFVAAVDESSKPSVDYVMGTTEWDDGFMGGSNVVTLQGDSGMVSMDINTKGYKPGEYTFSGRIGIKKPNNGGMEYHSFSSKFFVAEPSANVAATKMNVFYRGVDNPIKISAAGVPPSQLEYSVRGDGRIVKKGKEGLVVTNLKQKKVQKVTVMVYSNDGKDKKKLGEQEFRVKDLPNPDVYVRGISDKGIVAKQSFLVNPYLLCALPEYVNFEYKYKVVSFSMVITKNGDTFIKHATSAKLSPEMKDYIKNARKNSMIVFTDIQVQGPIRRRDVGSFVVKLN
jgi:gliding motility-associated protein GldM